MDRKIQMQRLPRSLGLYCNRTIQRLRVLPGSGTSGHVPSKTTTNYFVPAASTLSTQLFSKFSRCNLLKVTLRLPLLNLTHLCSPKQLLKDYSETKVPWANCYRRNQGKLSKSQHGSKIFRRSLTSIVIFSNLYPRIKSTKTGWTIGSRLIWCFNPEPMSLTLKKNYKRLLWITLVRKFKSC